MRVAPTIDLPSRPPLSSGSAGRSGTVAPAVLLAAIIAIALALLGYFGTRTIDGYPDPTQQWTD
jgi:hypothetical protein